jgi:hypothetical protein
VEKAPISEIMVQKMASDALVPFRWPKAWANSSFLGLLAGSPINCLLLESAGSGNPVAEGARRAGLEVFEGAPPAGQTVVSNLAWPRMKLSPRGRRDDAEAGPTGAPWIDSNS